MCSIFGLGQLISDGSFFVYMSRHYLPFLVIFRLHRLDAFQWITFTSSKKAYVGGCPSRKMSLGDWPSGNSVVCDVWFRLTSWVWTCAKAQYLRVEEYEIIHNVLNHAPLTPGISQLPKKTWKRKDYVERFTSFCSDINKIALLLALTSHTIYYNLSGERVGVYELL